MDSVTGAEKRRGAARR